MLKLILAQGYGFRTGDYGRTYTFNIYDENNVAFDGSTYNLPIIKVFDHASNSVVEPVTGSWTTQASGIGTFAFSPINHLTRAGPHYLEVQLEKPGTLISTERKKIAVFASP